MALDLLWETEIDADDNEDFDLDAWLNSDEEEGAKSATNIHQQDMNGANPAANDCNGDENVQSYKCPLCDEECDTYQALHVHANLCCSKTSHHEPPNNTNTNVALELGNNCSICGTSLPSPSASTSTTTTERHDQQPHRDEIVCCDECRARQQQQQQWKAILNMNQKRKLPQSDSDSNHSSSIVYHSTHKKRKLALPTKPSSMTKMSKKKKKKEWTQTTLDQIAAPFFGPIESDKGPKKITKQPAKVTAGAGAKIDLFPSENECLDTDEKSSQLHLKPTGQNTIAIKEKFLSLNGIQSRSHAGNKENVSMERSQRAVVHDALSDDEQRDDPLSPVMTPSAAVREKKSSRSKKKKRKSKTPTREIKFVPPWQIGNTDDNM